MIEKDNEIEIDLLELLRELLSKWWILLFSAIICGGLALLVSIVLITPLYQASALMYVNNTDASQNNSSNTISNSDLAAAQKLVDTYVVILKSRATLEEVLDRTGLDYTYEELENMVSASGVNSTEIFKIVVTSKDPAEAEMIANTITEVLPDKISNIVVGSDVRTVDYAVAPAHRSSPSYSRNTLIGILLGLVLSAGLIIVIYLTDENIRSEDYLTQNYPDIPLLAVIPDMTSSRHSGGYYSAYQRQSSTKSRQKGKGHAKK